MILQDIANIVAAAGIPWCYDHFKDEEPDPPYMVYYYPAENDFMADGENYANVRSLTFELYTTTKDTAREKAFEALLRAADLTWFKTTDFINDEKIFLTTYETEVLINGE